MKHLPLAMLLLGVAGCVPPPARRRTAMILDLSDHCARRQEWLVAARLAPRLSGPSMQHGGTP